MHKLVMCRVRPYYIYQCDLIHGSAHLRTSVAKGIEIIEGLRGHTTGYAVPQFVIDAPGGGGKVPINPGYILYHDHEKIVIRNYEGKIFEYPEQEMAEPPRRLRGRIFVFLREVVSVSVSCKHAYMRLRAYVHWSHERLTQIRQETRLFLTGRI